MEQQPAPAEGATEPEKPSKPVGKFHLDQGLKPRPPRCVHCPLGVAGPEFVRPVVGYFCNLCQLIFIDEDEAKLQHCSTPEHYRKYQVATETMRFTLQLFAAASFN